MTQAPKTFDWNEDGVQVNDNGGKVVNPQTPKSTKALLQKAVNQGKKMPSLKYNRKAKAAPMPEKMMGKALGKMKPNFKGNRKMIA